MSVEYTKQAFVQIHPQDNVLVALRNLAAGEQIQWKGKEITLPEAVAAKHKFAVESLEVGDKVFMYGVLVGKTTQAIPLGGLLSTANLVHATDSQANGSRKTDWDAPNVSRWQNRTFMGYHRADGQVGTANYWVVIPLVFCENRNVQTMRQAFLKELGYSRPQPYRKQVRRLVELYEDGHPAEALLGTDLETLVENTDDERVFPNVDGIKFLTHQMGCGGTRDDARTLCGLLAGYITHPNVAGATVLSLGCQNAQISILQEEIQLRAPNFDKPLVVLEQQQEGTEQQLLSKAIRETFVGLIKANQVYRRPAPLSKLTLGLECGGSDGFSGISANPAVGHVSDMLVALGGTTILSEFPELCGVEDELSSRCITDAVSNRFLHLMESYQNRAEAVGSGFDANPSPGNIKDGLITDAIKSAGAAKKGGTSPIQDVLDYPEKVNKPGLNLLCTPGGDVESVTAMIGSGANIAVFTTGLGTPTGNPIAPVLKISTNTPLAVRMPDIIDLDAGPIISGEATIEEIGEQLLDLIVSVASGETTAKAVGLGQDDFIPWKRGVSL
ncbi:UxaA family hydrolase [Flavilitoribacter nigricans]|uniref:Altronate hydrolase n=1 Tax=Flavilitoribacter nigricans (strain ATCC 23147 / DSM 23189 / NBRC 102662 / NCIMB 1420 / SS-2) TaxID=1122177 RepID=A0A2D0NGB0_FLAN2|nr:altronate dehydratase family protein [Flavilitoribacter nigricans]PHN07420.1 altronate hydrolase [Flavilitoribacter nigricans DSM 23189 = NBRC 102662]